MADERTRYSQVNNWITKTLTDQSASQKDIELAKLINEAVRKGKIKFLLDEINFRELNLRRGKELAISPLSC